MAQGRSSKIISMIEWIRTSRLSIKNSLFVARRYVWNYFHFIEWLQRQHPSGEGLSAPQASVLACLKVPTLDLMHVNCQKQWLQCTTSEVAFIHFWRQVPPKSAKLTFEIAPRLILGSSTYHARLQVKN
jgi:hypothetical protein